MKQGTIEESADNFANSKEWMNGGATDWVQYTFKNGAKSDAAKEYWFKIFQEQEAYKIVHDLMVDINLNGLVINDDIDLKKWFDQLKKKQ